MAIDWKRVLIGRWSWKRPFYFLATVYGSLCLFAVSCADRLIFHPPPFSYSVKTPPFLSIQDDGKEPIAAYYRAPRKGYPVLLWSHGNAENLASLSRTLDEFHAEGYGVLGYDYPGYGESPGEPSEDGCYRAISSSYQFLLRQGHPASKIFAIGQSVGSGPTCWLAAQEELGGVILISPFLSTFRVMTRVGILPFDRFPNLKRVREFEHPLLLIHGTQDRVIPFWHGEKLFKAASSPQKTFISLPGIGHNDPEMLFSEESQQAIREFTSK